MNIMESIIRDASLARVGAQKIEWVRKHMPVLGSIAEQYQKEQPLKGKKAVVCVHLEAKTAYLAEVMHQAGAEVYAVGSNPLSTQDDVCAGLAQSGVTVFATHGCTAEEYNSYQCKALSVLPDVIIDDGGDMMTLLHEQHPEWAVNLAGGCEETTTGIIRIRNRAKAGQLRFPMFNINDADSSTFLTTVTAPAKACGTASCAPPTWSYLALRRWWWATAGAARA